MHVMFGLDGGSSSVRLSAVAFELTGDVREPHELLQFEERWLDLTLWVDPELGFRQTVDPETTSGFEQFFDFCARWMGKRGGAWPRNHQDLTYSAGMLQHFVGRTPWKLDQVFDFRTLLMLAQKVPRALFRAPDMRGAGLNATQALHVCVSQAVYAQAAFRALAEHTASRENEALLKRLGE